MTKSTALNFTQALNNISAQFTSADLPSVVAVSPNNNGNNLTAGTRTFTAAGGTVQTGGAAATWTATVTDSRVVAPPVITEPGSYTATPTVTANAATVDSGSSNATWNLKVEIIKTLYTAGANDAVVKALNASSWDSAARAATLWLVDANGQNMMLGAVNIPLNSGSTGGLATVDLMAGLFLVGLPYDAQGKRVLPLKAGQVLKVSIPAITAATQIHITGQVEEY